MLVAWRSSSSRRASSFTGHTRWFIASILRLRVAFGGGNLGHLTTGFLACPARLNAFFHLFVVVPGALLGAFLARIGADQASHGNQLALAANQIGRQAAELVTVERQRGGSVVHLVAVLDLLEAMVKRLVADVRALAAGLQACAVQLVVVVVRLLGPCFSWSQQGDAPDAHAQRTEDFSSIHTKLLSSLCDLSCPSPLSGRLQSVPFQEIQQSLGLRQYILADPPLLGRRMFHAGLMMMLSEALLAKPNTGKTY